MKTQVLLIAIVSLLLAPLSDCNGQGDSTSSRRESSAIEAIEKVGGRVYRISAADTSREVSFYLAPEPVSDDQIAELSAVNDVVWLNLANSKVTAKGLKHIEGMQLKKLHLEKSTVKDDALDIVRKQKNLEYLNLYGTEITDLGLEKLSEMKSLKKLYVWQTKTTDAGIKKLQESLPDLKVIGECKLVALPPAKKEDKKEMKKEATKKEDKEAKETPKKEDKDKSEKEADKSKGKAEDKKDESEKS